MNIVDECKRIKAIAEPMLMDGVTIAYIGFMPFDMHPFGSKGFSLVLNKKGQPEMEHGLIFPDEPSYDDVKAAVDYIQKIFFKVP